MTDGDGGQDVHGDARDTLDADSPAVINFADRIRDALLAQRDPDSHRELDPRVFHPSQIGYCKRQAYLSKLGLKDDSDILGMFHTGTLIHEFMENVVGADHLPDHVALEQAVEHEVDGIKFVGHADCYDPKQGVVYDYKSRGGWYNFDPPTQRHTDQLLVYMDALGARDGRVVYISKKDLEVRPWPEDGTFAFDAERLAELVTKAKEIRDAIVTNGIATDESEIPFDKCGCYFCGEESLHFPDDL